MRWYLRVSLVALAGSFGCVGGPVSDWPAKGHDDPTDSDGESGPHPNTPINAGSGAMDGGVKSPPVASDQGEDLRADGGAGDGGAPCSDDAGACRAACVSDASPIDPVAQARFGCTDAPALRD